MSFPRYPAYKPSGVEWLGEVPEHWLVEPFKRQIERNDGGSWGDDPEGLMDTIVLRSTEQTVDGRWKIEDPSFRKLNDHDKNGSLLVEGDLLLTKSSGSSLHIGKTTLVDKQIENLQCCFSNFMQRIRLKSTVLPRLGWYILNNRISRFQLDFLSNTTTGLANLNATIIGQIIIPTPPGHEQQAIISFLDHETAKIDALIAEQQRLIELLQEKRQAVISHAVTKGLNPDAPMKDSGVEWLGEVPEHWDCGKIKHYFRTASGSTPNTESQDLYYSTEEEGIPWIRTTDIADGDVTRAEIFITENALADTACDLLPAGTVLVALYGGAGTVGKNGILRIESAINQALCGLLPNARCLPDYSFRYVQFLKPFWMERAVSARKAGNISQELVRDTQFALPPIDEQHEIACFLDSRLAELDVLQSQCKLAIDTLQERRSALISAAVTGQIDVRGLVPEAVAA